MNIQSLSLRLVFFLAWTAPQYAYSDTEEMETVIPANINFGAIGIAPSLEVIERYDTNILSQPSLEDLDSWVTVIVPKIASEMDYKRHNLKFVYRHESGYYDSSSDDNYSDNKAATDYTWELGGVREFTMKALYNRAHEDRGTGYSQGALDQLPEEPDRFHEGRLRIGLATGDWNTRSRFSISLSSYEKRFINRRDVTRERDYQAHSAGGTGRYKIAGKTHALVKYSYTTIRYLNDAVISRDSDEQLALAGLTWEPTGKLTGTLTLGYETKEFDAPERDNFSGLSHEVSLHYFLKTYSELVITSSRVPRETDGNGDFIDSQSQEVNWVHNWNDRLDTSIFYRFTENTYEAAVPAREDEFDSYGLEVNYQFRRWFSAGVSFESYDKDSTLGEFAYDRDISSLNMKLSF